MPAASAAVRALPHVSCHFSWQPITLSDEHWNKTCLLTAGGATDKKKLCTKSPVKMVEYYKVTRAFVLFVIWRRGFWWAYLLRVWQSCFSSRQHVNQRLDRLLHNSLLHSGFSLKILEDTQSALRETSIIISETGYRPHFCSLQQTQCATTVIIQETQC